MMKKVLIAFVISQLAPCNVLAFSLVKKTVSGISSSSVSTSTSTSSSRFITERNVHHNGNDQSNNDISNTNNNNNNNNDNTTPATRQKFISTLASSTVAIIGGSQGLLQQVQPARAESRPESLDVDNFLRTGESGDNCIILFKCVCIVDSVSIINYLSLWCDYSNLLIATLMTKIT
jgi:hypothetical protein